MHSKRHGSVQPQEPGSRRWHHDPEQTPSDGGPHHGHGGQRSNEGHHGNEGHRGRGGRRAYGGHDLHSGRKLSSSDLQIVLLALLVDKPAHGYELIKSLDDHSHGLYVPSPGMIYPALTYLEEIGLASVETEGARKRYSLTEAGRDYYQQRQDVSSRILSDLERVGREMERARQVVESGVVSGDSDDGAKSKVNTLMEFNTGAYNEYITSLFAPQDSDLVEALAEMKRENVRNMNVSASEGKLLQVLALAIGAKRILEIGTLGGYSGIHLARALPEGGKLITLEIDPHHAEVARRNLGRAGVAQKVDIRIGPASETLEQLAQAGEPLFDLIFIDADKDGYTEYLRQSLPLLRVGGLLLADNTLPGAVLTQGDSGTKRYNAAVAECPGLTTIVIPTLRHQGIDGLTVSFRNA